MNKKLFTTLLALLMIAAMLLGACSSATTQAPAEEPEAQPEPTEEVMEEEAEEPAAPADMYADVDPSGQTVIFWHNHSQEREVALLEIIDEFNQSNEWGITVDGGICRQLQRYLQQDAGNFELAGCSECGGRLSEPGCNLPAWRWSG